MKKISICLLIVGTVSIGNALGTNLCVRMPQSTLCAIPDNYPDTTWTFSCPGVSVSGISVCTNTSSSGGTVVDLLKSESVQVGQSVYCWCKMTAPAVSRWVFTAQMSNANACVSGCAYKCQSTTSNINYYFGSIMR